MTEAKAQDCNVFGAVGRAAGAVELIHKWLDGTASCSSTTKGLSAGL